MATVTDRTTELERYIARLHGRIRSLESTLEILGGMGTVLTKTATEKGDGPPLNTPDGIHVLERPWRYQDDDEDVTTGFWQARCSCGWESDRTAQEGPAHRQGREHVGEVEKIDLGLDA